MRNAAQALLLVFACLLAWTSSSPALAQAPFESVSPGEGEASTRISLVTMGSGDHLFTRGGHAALLVEHLRGENVLDDAVYNFGDADWEDISIPWHFVMGSLKFRLSVPGGLTAVATDYGVHQNRDVFTQVLALTPMQAFALETRLRTLNTDESRWYEHHYAKSICTTKIRDLLDEVLGDPIATQLKPLSDERSIRSHQRQSFDGKAIGGLAADLLLGRANDRTLTRYEALFVPQSMREYLQNVMVPNPSGEGEVALAALPLQVAGRQGPSPTSGQTWGSWWLAGLGCLWLAWCARGGLRPSLEGLGSTIVWPALISCTFSLVLAGLMSLTYVPEFRVNELILTLLPLDVLLLWWGVMLGRGKRAAYTPLRSYVRVRLGLSVLILLLHGAGVLVQRPLALPLFMLLYFGTLVLMTRAKTPVEAS